MTDEPERLDAPNQQVVRPDGSGPAEEGKGGGKAAKAAPKAAKPAPGKRAADTSDPAESREEAS
jgi:hypothetical protein